MRVHNAYYVKSLTYQGCHLKWWPPANTVWRHNLSLKIAHWCCLPAYMGFFPDESFTVSHSTSPDHTTLKAQHFRSSGLLCRRSDGLELATGQSPWPGAHQQQLQTIAKDEPISTILRTHAAVEMPHESALYNSIIDIDIDFDISMLGLSRNRVRVSVRFPCDMKVGLKKN